jgi:hypothetical protein
MKHGHSVTLAAPKSYMIVFFTRLYLEEQRGIESVCKFGAPKSAFELCCVVGSCAVRLASCPTPLALALSSWQQEAPRYLSSP